VALPGQETIPEDDYMFLACGSGKNGQCGNEFLGVAKAKERHEVRCCSWEPNYHGWIKNTGCNNWHASELAGTDVNKDHNYGGRYNKCFDASTYAEAQQICAANDAYVCTREQVLNVCAKGEFSYY